MASKRKQRSSQETVVAAPVQEMAAPEEVEIEIITDSCLDRLKIELNNPFLQFAEVQATKPQREQMYVLTKMGEPVSPFAGTKQVDLPVFPLPLQLKNPPSTTYWLGMRLKFRFVQRKTKAQIASVTLYLSRGTRITERQDIIRAEWDWHEDSHKVPHAQPHWHVYTGFSDRTRSEAVNPFYVQSDEEESPAMEFSSEMVAAVEIDKPSKGWDNGGDPKFHYAMAANWQAEPALGASGNSVIYSCKQPIGSVSLPNWITECIKYIRGQLEYLEDKKGKKLPLGQPTDFLDNSPP
ncbi:MAG: hypothetical protein M3347_03770 [Armatimonadota bacterium]|nr:hypothetical protein [Armatimonadota bacterium]